MPKFSPPLNPPPLVVNFSRGHRGFLIWVLRRPRRYARSSCSRPNICLASGRRSYQQRSVRADDQSLPVGSSDTNFHSGISGDAAATLMPRGKEDWLTQSCQMAPKTTDSGLITAIKLSSLSHRGRLASWSSSEDGNGNESVLES